MTVVVGVQAPLLTEQSIPIRPVPVLRRKIVWSGGVIRIKIPANDAAQSGCVETSEGILRYFHFSKFVKGVEKGGVVNFFLHAENPDRFQGMMLNVSVEILQKDFEDGRAFLHVDLRPVPDETPVTHRLAVVCRALDLPDDLGPAFEVFKTPEPLRGAIVLMSPEAKLPDVSTRQRLPEALRPTQPLLPQVLVEALKQEKRRHSLPGVAKPTVLAEPARPYDSQLVRLIAQGWAIKEDGSAVVILSKEGKNDLVHHRPKLKHAKSQKH